MDREQTIHWLEDYTAHDRTICEVFREIWDELLLMPKSDVKSTLQDLVIEGFQYGKKMTAKLVTNRKMLIDAGLIKEKPKSLKKNHNKLRNKTIRQARGREVRDD